MKYKSWRNKGQTVYKIQVNKVLWNFMEMAKFTTLQMYSSLIFVGYSRSATMILPTVHHDSEFPTSLNCTGMALLEWNKSRIHWTLECITLTLLCIVQPPWFKLSYKHKCKFSCLHSNSKNAFMNECNHFVIIHFNEKMKHIHGMVFIRYNGLIAFLRKNSQLLFCYLFQIYAFFI